ncbi:MAG: beta-N-acetylhexosaminidase [Bdellovibrionales bacterium]|nr:beta-N-acetylhexosaminidase [Bdellovibrionales bacterium]
MKEKLGSLILAGLPGQDLAETSKSFLKKSAIGGVIFFGPNYESPAQIAEMINEAQAARLAGAHPLPLWTSLDQEGGRVQRFKAPFTKIPEAIQVGIAGSPKLAFELSELMATELKAVGINLNFFPVADVNSNPKNPVIGPRAYGSTEEEVSKMVTAAVRGHLTAGVTPCVKHFPGHGDTHVDSHWALPSVNTDLETLRSREVAPFLKAFKARCPMVMTAHLLNPRLDPDHPATFSEKTLQKFLREELRFKGIIISDDLLMKAVVDHYGETEIPVLAINAGCDLLCYRNQETAEKAYEALVHGWESGKLSKERVAQSIERHEKAKAELIQDYKPVEIQEISKAFNTEKAQTLLAAIEAESVKNGYRADLASRYDPTTRSKA